MAPDPRLVQVEIFGQTYRLRADEDPEYVQNLAAHVDNRMREVARQTSAVDSLKVAVLTALNIADDHHRLQRESREAAEGRPAESRVAAGAGQALDNRITEWTQLLDEALGG